MSETAKWDTDEMRYLLGSLSEDEKTRMEDSFFADDSKFEALELAEDELIDAYVRGSLPAKERSQFKRSLLLSPKLAERANFATLLATKADSFGSHATTVTSDPALLPSSSYGTKTRGWGFFKQRPAWGMALAASLVIILGGMGLLSGWWRLRSESARLAAERSEVLLQKQELDRRLAEQRAIDAQASTPAYVANSTNRNTNDAGPGPFKKEPTQPVMGSVVSITLFPGGTRGDAGGNELRLGPADAAAKLSLALERNEYRSYVATVRNSQGVVFTQSRLTSQIQNSTNFLAFNVPAKRLPAGDYTVIVKGFSPTGPPEQVSSYSFRVSTQR